MWSIECGPWYILQSYVTQQGQKRLVWEAPTRVFQLIRDVFDEYRQVLGAEKIRTILVQRGHQISAEYVSRLMREMGLSSVRMTAKKKYLKLREPERKKNILQQQFTADQPNQRWVSDVTCFKLRDHYFYICVIIDLFSRKVIAHKISKRNSTQLITAAFKMAYEERQPPSGLIFHSDRGAQYTSHRLQQLLHKHNVEQSFSQPGKPHDNAVAESFFASLKKEELYRKDHPSDRAFQASVASYIEFYNTKRPHRTLKNLTPCQMEESCCATVKWDIRVRTALSFRFLLQFEVVWAFLSYIFHGASILKNAVTSRFLRHKMTLLNPQVSSTCSNRVGSFNAVPL